MKHSYPTSEALKFLLQMAHNREIALPDFQRDFVWDPFATDELIESIISNIPPAALLRIKNGPYETIQTSSYIANTKGNPGTQAPGPLPTTKANLAETNPAPAAAAGNTKTAVAVN